MRKFSSELYEAIYDGFLADYEDGLISEADMREFEKDAFIEVDETPQGETPLVMERTAT